MWLIDEYVEDVFDDGDILEHVGVGKLDGAPGRGSGRYELGSGDNAYQRNADFMARIKKYEKSGMNQKEIADAEGMSINELRSRRSNASNFIREQNRRQAAAYLEEGKGYSEIGRLMGVNESTVRGWLDPKVKTDSAASHKTAEQLKEILKEKKYIDVGSGTNFDLGVSSYQFKNALQELKDEGYEVHNIYIQQMNADDARKTTMTVLAPPGTTQKEIFKNQGDIRMAVDSVVYDEKGNVTSVNEPQPVTSISSDRVMIRYAEDGGKEKDGVIELRRGVPDLSLGQAKYAQVRIGVDGTHYLKGMALYSDDMPEGVDVIFNTNKHNDKSKFEVLKKMKSDEPSNPFGSSLKPEEKLKMVQKYYIDENGEKKISPINIVNEEGDWGEWSKTLSSQFLSKQPLNLAKRQLNLSYAEKKDEFGDICALTNPTLKKELLTQFADKCDSAAVDLKAAGLPRQGSHVIIPITSMKDDQVYAPNYENGQVVALVRHPHGGRFEIPILTVNNNNAEAKSVLGNARDAIGIHSNVAERLSGADFDGDTVLVLPITSASGEKIADIRNKPALKGLEGFDPKEAYPAYEGMPKMKPQTKQIEMGKVSNLITDMTLLGATDDELARAVRHSMVVIDAEKHNLNYQQSFKDNNIGQLKVKYQGSANGGAATLISRAKSKEDVEQRSMYVKTDPETGKKVYSETGRTKDQYPKHTIFLKETDPVTGDIHTRAVQPKIVKERNAKGRLVNKYLPPDPGTEVDAIPTKKVVMEKVTRMSNTDDANTLLSDARTPMERAYAQYANEMKALANAARKEAYMTKERKPDPQAAVKYKEEVSSLNEKLARAQKNAPRERFAQLQASLTVKEKRDANPDMDKDEVKKYKATQLGVARARVGAKKEQIVINDREWEAIQAGAISKTKLAAIFKNCDQDKLKERAMPRDTGTISSTKKSRIKQLGAANFTQAEIAKACGVSPSTVWAILNGQQE